MHRARTLPCAFLLVLLPLSGCATHARPERPVTGYVRYACDEKLETGDGAFNITDDYGWSASWRKTFGHEMSIEITAPAPEAFSTSGFASLDASRPVVFVRYDMSWIGSTYQSLSAELGTSGRSVRQPLDRGGKLALTLADLSHVLESPGDLTARLYSLDNVLREDTLPRELPFTVERTLQSLHKSAIERSRDRERLCERRESIFLD